MSLSITASDSTSGTLSYTAIGLPPGLAINNLSGLITGTIAPTAVGVAKAASFGIPQTYDVLVTAEDGTYVNTQDIPWTILDPVSIASIADQTTSKGATVSLTPSATDAAAGTLTFSAVGLPAGLSLNASSGAITGTVAPGTAAGSPYFVLLSATDGIYTGAQDILWNVTDPVSLAPVADQTTSEGASVSLSLSGTDTTDAR